MAMATVSQRHGEGKAKAWHGYGIALRKTWHGNSMATSPRMHGKCNANGLQDPGTGIANGQGDIMGNAWQTHIGAHIAHVKAPAWQPW